MLDDGQRCLVVERTHEDHKRTVVRAPAARRSAEANVGDVVDTTERVGNLLNRSLYQTERSENPVGQSQAHCKSRQKIPQL